MKKIVVLIMLSIFSLGSIHADDIEWEISADGTLTISGTYMGDYAFWWDDYNHTLYPPWYDKRNEIKKVVIEMGVINIGSFAFKDCSKLNYIAIPESVTSIGQHAFDGCSSLKSITIPNSVTGSLESGTFAGCRSLTSITIPNSVTSIENNSLLWQCGCFEGCSNLTSITIPNSVTSIGESTFRGCSSLNSITIPNSVSSIESWTFDGCWSLNSITIPESVTSIGQHAFDGSYEWYDNLPDGLVYLGKVLYAYKGTMPSNTQIDIKEGTIKIGDYAFYGCSGLTSITIPNSVTGIGSDVFNGCSGLASITVEGGNAYFDSRNSCNAIIETKSNILIRGCDNTVIPNSVTCIGPSAFSECSSLTSIIIPESVTCIGWEAFSGCSGLTSITIPNSVTSIGDNAFSGCISLTSITIPNSVTSIELGAFAGCSGLTSINIPNSVTSIESSAFLGCFGLSSVTIPNSVTSISYSAFYNCSGLTSVACEATTPPFCGSDCFGGVNKSIPVYVPVNSIEAYKKASEWSTFTNIQAIINDQSIANAVIEKIEAIGKVEYTDACKNKIDDANTAYNALTDEQKAFVTNLNVLTTAQQTYETLKAAAEKLAADKAKADPVIAKINAIGTVEYTDACKYKIDAASTAYKALTDDQKALVTNIDVLTTAKQTYDALKAAADKLAADKAAANKVVNKIKAIGKVEYTYACKDRIDEANNAYNALTADQKALVMNLDVLTTAKQTYDNLKAAADKLAADKAAADPVIAKIDAIGKVEYTYACKDKIDEANNAYNALTADQKALVTNLDVLKTAKQTYDNLKAAAEKLAADKAKADPVIAKINAIGKVEYTDACKNKIDAASTAYNALTADQKALVTNLDVLTTAQQTYDNLKAAAEKLAADKAAFDKYKSEIIAIIESLVKEDDSDAVKEIINKAISEIDALKYEDAISLDDNKAKVNSFATSVNEAVENQRAEDEKTNGIEEPELAEKVNIYDLNGRKITNSMLKSGLYIRNGKKVVVK